ncbi:MAG: hypothetical protein IKT09_06515 [Synergistes sp.]|nr:hypothetical protein [Synergistes sp.]
MWAFAEYDLTVIQGQTAGFSFAFKDESDTAINLSGYSAECKIRNNGGDLVVSMTAAITAADGLVSLSLTDVQTKTLPTGTLYYDLALEKSGVVEKPLRGKFIVLRGASNV